MVFLFKPKGGERMGVVIGFAMIIFTLVVGTAIGMKANKNVRSFNDEEHEIFVGNEAEKES